MNKNTEIIIEALEGFMPMRATSGSVGYDLLANIKREIAIAPNERLLIKTGVKLKLPHGFEAQVRSRSGLVAKNGVIVLNSPGTIDSDYTGEVGVILYNASDKPYKIQPKEKIAQLVFAKVEFASNDCVILKDRDENGFGSTD